MIQSADVVGPKHPIDKFMASLPMLHSDEWFVERMEQLSKSVGYRMADNEDMKRRGCHQWDIEQNRLNTEAYIKQFAYETLKTCRVVNAGTERLRAKCRGEQAQIAEVDERDIEREAESEINRIWLRACKIT